MTSHHIRFTMPKGAINSNDLRENECRPAASYLGIPASESSGRYAGTHVLKFTLRFRRGPYVKSGFRPTLKRPAKNDRPKRNCTRRRPWLTWSPAVRSLVSIVAPPARFEERITIHTRFSGHKYLKTQHNGGNRRGPTKARAGCSVLAVVL